MSLTWGIIADVDIHSEVIRFVGQSRYTIYGAYKILKGDTYHAKLEHNGQLITNMKGYDQIKPIDHVSTLNEPST